nr:venom protein U-MPTX.7-Mc17 [Megalopyge crispata]
MKTLLVVCVSLAALAVVVYADDDPPFEEILKNKRWLKAYAMCFLDKGPCTSKGHEVKKLIPKSLETQCKTCTQDDRDGTRKIINAYKTELPELWKEMLAHFDPGTKYTANLEEFLNSKN